MERVATFVVVFGLVIVFASAHPVLDPDMWWHLAVGESILQHRSVYFVDPFSFTNPKVWVNSQWLTEAVFAAICKVVGIWGLEVIALVLKVVTFLLVFKAMKAPPLTKVWVTILFAFGALPVMGGVRPQLISFLFLAWLSLTIHQHRQISETNTNTKSQWLFSRLPVPLSLPLLFALWANVHSFYPLGFCLLILALVGDFLNERRNQQPVLGNEWRKQLALALLFCLLAVMITPFGWNSLKQVIVNIVHSSKLPIEEWKPVVAMRHPMVAIWACLLLIWLVCLAWSPKRPDALELLWGAFVTFSALTGVRMIALWCLLIAPFVGEHIGQWIHRSAFSNSSQTRIPNWLPITLFALFAVASVTIFAVKFSPIEFSKREQKEYPARAVEWVKGSRFVNCLTRYDWGGYVAWKLKGRIKIFVDGRADFYPTKVMNDFVSAYFGKANWQEVLNRYGVTIAILPPDAPLANLLSLKTSEWRCVYRDGVALVFIRRFLATSLPRQPVKLRKANGNGEARQPQF